MIKLRDDTGYVAKLMTHLAQDYIWLLFTAEDLQLTGQLDDTKGIEFKLSADALRGRWPLVVKTMRPGGPINAQYLGNRAFAVLWDRATNTPRSYGARLVMTLLAWMVTHPDYASTVLEDFKNLVKEVAGDLVLAVHAGDRGFTLSSAIAIKRKDPRHAEDALDRFVQALTGWIRAELEELLPNDANPLTVEKGPLPLRSTRGIFYRISVPKQATIARQIFGTHLEIALARQDQVAFLMIGEGARLHMHNAVRTVTRKHRDDALTEQKNIAEQIAHGRRGGQVMFSPVALRRPNTASGDPTAPLVRIDWGLNKQRTRFDVTLYVPFSELEGLTSDLLGERMQNLMRRLRPGRRSH